jgi:predicted nucleic acid-binding protein
MIVLDASALVELLLHTEAGEAVAARVADPSIGLHIPHLADIEVTQALRRYAQIRALQAVEAADALSELHALDLQRHAHEPLLDRVWELRDNLSAYDATYVALAEVLGTIVLTCDAPLSRAPGLSRRVELVDPTKRPGPRRPATS